MTGRDKYTALGRQPRTGRARAPEAGKTVPSGYGAVLDAVTVIAALDPGNAHHTASREALRSLAGAPKLIHPINLAEVLVQPVKDGTEEKTQAVLKRAGITTFVPGGGEPLALARSRAMTGLKMPDACAHVTALAHRLPLVTFDRRLTIAARAAGLTVLGAPDDWQP